MYSTRLEASGHVATALGPAEPAISPSRYVIASASQGKVLALAHLSRYMSSSSRK